MTWIVPARMTDIARIAEHGVAGLGAFLDFLEDTGRLHPGSMHVRALRKELARAAGGFEAAMADRGGSRAAETLYEAKRAGGVDITHEDAVPVRLAAVQEADGDRRHSRFDRVTAARRG